jgi:hypothetical protein
LPRGPLRLALRRQAALDAAPLRFGLALGARAVDHLLLLVHADDDVPDDLVHHLQAAIQLLHQLAGSVDYLEHVHAFLLVPNLVGQPAASPVFGLFDLPVQPRHDLLDLRVQLGHLLFGRVGRKDVDELVLSIGHAQCSLRTRSVRL